MHEVSIANEIISIVTNSLPEQGCVKVKSVKLDLGEFSNILPDALKFGFEVLSAGTVMEGAELNINLCPLTLRCYYCGFISVSEPGFLFCSECGCNEVNIESGNEIKVVEIEIYDN